MFSALHLEEQRVHQHRRLHALARDHQQREDEDAPERAPRRPGRDEAVELAFDVLLHVPPGAPHVDRQRRHEEGGDDAEDAFPERLVARLGEQQPGADAQRDRRGDAPVNRRNQRPAAGLPQVGEADGDDQKRLEPFPERDDECLEHGCNPRRIVSIVSREVRPVKSAIRVARGRACRNATYVRPFHADRGVADGVMRRRSFDSCSAACPGGALDDSRAQPRPTTSPARAPLHSSRCSSTATTTTRGRSASTIRRATSTSSTSASRSRRS